MQASSIASPRATNAPDRPANVNLISVLKETAGDWMEDNAMRLSAALSLYTILSLAPLLVFTIKFVSMLWVGKSSARTEIMAQMSNLMGSQAAEALKPMLDSGGKSGSGLVATLISTGVLIFSATGVFIELQDSMNTIWGVKPKPHQGIWGFVRNRLLSVGMVFGMAFLLLVSMFVSTMLSAMARQIAGDTRWFAFLLDIVVSFGVVTLLFAGIFKFLPDVKIRWRYVWLGAICTAALFTLGKYGLTLYFKYATPTSAFGAAGSLAAVLIWVYYSAFILFFGAEFTKVWSLRHNGHRVVPEENAVKVTEDERAEMGIPSDRRMQQALAGQSPAGGKSRGESAPPNTFSHLPEKGMAAYIVAMSVIAGSLGISYLAGKKQGENDSRRRAARNPQRG